MFFCGDPRELPGEANFVPLIWSPKTYDYHCQDADHKLKPCKLVGNKYPLGWHFSDYRSPKDEPIGKLFICTQSAT